MSDLACGYCGAAGLEMHRDHLIPRSRGGSDDAENCVMACEPCNQAKSDMAPSEWQPTGLPEAIYAREKTLGARYRMKARSARGRAAGWKFDERATSALFAIARALETPNESDSNLETPAGVTDGLFEMSRAIRSLGHVIARGQCATLGHHWVTRGYPGYSVCQWCGVRGET